MINLSILIPTIVSRKGFLNRLLETLENQIIQNALENKIEILVSSDNREVPTGAKRNHLTRLASGKFRSFIDDDDLVSDSYCKSINDIIEEKGDQINYIGFNLKYIENGNDGFKTAFHTLTKGHTSWCEDDAGYYRPINHLNPMKTDVARLASFPDIVFGEDGQWCEEILKSNSVSTGTEHYINEIMYIYDCWTDKNREHSYSYTPKTEVIKYV